MSESNAPVPDHQLPAASGPEGQLETSPAQAQTASTASSQAGESKETPAPEQTLLEQMGGVSGLAYSAVPIVVFVLVNAVTSLMPAIWSAVGVALLIAVVRVVRKEPLQPAISGVLGIAVCSFIAYRSGDAKGFFLLGIWTSLVYGGVFLISVLVRWPLVGTAWSALNGLGFNWRQQRRAMLGYDLATLAWVVVFAAKFVVQQWLYTADETAWLAFARIVMGYPMTVLALVVTVWAIRRASKVAEEVEAAEERDVHEESPSTRPNPSAG